MAISVGTGLHALVPLVEAPWAIEEARAGAELSAAYDIVATWDL